MPHQTEDVRACSALPPANESGAIPHPSLLASYSPNATK